MNDGCEAGEKGGVEKEERIADDEGVSFSMEGLDNRRLDEE